MIRIISLNIWGGREYDDVIGIFRRHAADTDVFCLQEALDTDGRKTSSRPDEKPTNGDIFRRIAEALPEFDGAFARFEGHHDRGSLAMFVRRDMEHEGISQMTVFAPPVSEAIERHFTRKLQWTVIPHADARLLIANFHGLWN